MPRQRQYRKRKPKRQTQVQKYMGMSMRNAGMKLFNTPHTFIRYSDATDTISSNYTAESLGHYVFYLGDIVSYTDFTALFDSYRLLSVEVEFDQIAIQQQNQLAGSNIANNNFVPNIYVAVDCDDATTPSSIDELRQRPNVRKYPMTKSFKIRLSPKIANAIWESSIATAYTQQRGHPWLDCGEPNVEHFGLKYGCETTGAADNTKNFVYRVTRRYLLQCKQPR